MATKLHQIIALVPTAKSRHQGSITSRHHIHKKPSLFEGLSRSYTPLKDGDEVLPPENKRVEATVDESIKEISETFTQVCNLVRDQDEANAKARADIVVDGTVLLKDVPVTHLLFLEKHIQNLVTFIEEIPTLDPSHKWTYDSDAGYYRSDEISKMRTKKEQKAIVLYDATTEHPAQTQLITEDVNAGIWKEQKLSGAISATHKKTWLSNVRRLHDAVVAAREAGNSAEVDSKSKEGETLFQFIFGK